ncbi:hypothetical protein HC251_09270 [Iamia sp. SCSIO 61187]|uniref:hypothetical protein n=1 Tax=Iamia sp. SCSIO 61187 TaxID=2722752 RepID=UPI001C639FAF|nr:hypothetical protein [Iamia sp. SCSIO 61187]QYG92608.1 hypothetical protein HC251_09270 [Iamia sp. SCSIO 61187]
MDVGTGQDDSGPGDGERTPATEGARTGPRAGEGGDPLDLTDVTEAGAHDGDEPVVIDLRDGIDTIAAYEADRARRAADGSRDRR